MDTAILDLENNQGTTFRQQFILKSGDTGLPTDLTGCSAKMQVKPSRNSDTVYVELSSANGGITLGGASGEVNLFFSAEISASLSFSYAVYDMNLILLNGDVTRPIRGSFSIIAGVTK